VRPQDPVGPAIALELEHDVDEVLERLGAGDAAILGDVTDDDRRDPRGLGELHQPARALADLRKRARNRVEQRGVYGLDRIDREHRWALALSLRQDVSMRQDPLDVGLGDDRQRGSRRAHPSRAHRRLRDRLLARRVQHAAAAGQPGERLDQQRRLADAGIAAEQHQATRDHAAAQHAIELTDPGGPAIASTDLHGIRGIRDRDRRSAIRYTRRPRPRQRCAIDLFDEARPLLTQRAAAKPLGLAMTARLAPPDRPALLRSGTRLHHAAS
jgi:hypothetical protein